MKFTYQKIEHALVLSDHAPGVTHVFKLEGPLSDFAIEASSEGVFFHGCSPFFQPEEGECHLPVDDFREFMARLSMAFDLSWKEQQKEKKEVMARQMILGAK